MPLAPSKAPETGLLMSSHVRDERLKYTRRSPGHHEPARWRDAAFRRFRCSKVRLTVRGRCRNVGGMLEKRPHVRQHYLRRSTTFTRWPSRLCRSGPGTEAGGVNLLRTLGLRAGAPAATGDASTFQRLRFGVGQSSSRTPFRPSLKVMRTFAPLLAGMVSPLLPETITVFLAAVPDAEAVTGLSSPEMNLYKHLTICMGSV